MVAIHQRAVPTGRRDLRQTNARTHPFEPVEVLVLVQDLLNFHAIRNLLARRRAVSRAILLQEGKDVLTPSVGVDRVNLNANQVSHYAPITCGLSERTCLMAVPMSLSIVKRGYARIPTM